MSRAANIRPLSELDEIRWHELGHCYGPAHDAPAMIRGLVSKHADEREDGWSFLYGSLLHQGDVFGDATAAALPFLLGLAAEPQSPSRGQLFEYICMLAGARHELAVTKAAFAESLPVFEGWLRARSGKQREAACYVIANIAPRVPTLEAVLWDLAEKTRSDSFRDSLLVALWAIGETRGAGCLSFNERFAAHLPSAMAALALRAVHARTTLDVSLLEQVEMTLLGSTPLAFHTFDQPEDFALPVQLPPVFPPLTDVWMSCPRTPAKLLFIGERLTVLDGPENQRILVHARVPGLQVGDALFFGSHQGAAGDAVVIFAAVDSGYRAMLQFRSELVADVVIPILPDVPSG